MREIQIQTLDIEKIKTNPFQPRKEFESDGLDEMAQSIRIHGIIQPLVVRRVNEEYQLIAGERRLRAARLAGITEVPVISISAEGIEVAEISLIENIQRRNLNPIEEAEAYSVITEKFRLTQEELSKRVGKSRSYIANSMRLKSLHEEIKAGLRDGLISSGHAKALLGVQNEDERLRLYNRIITEQLNVRQVERAVKGKKAVPVSDTPSPETGKKEGQKIRRIVKDARIFFNEIKRVVEEIRGTGAKAEVIERETESYFEIIARIPKNRE